MLDKNKNKILSDNAGFTLVELLASIFIIALISGIFMVNYNNTSKRSQLKMATQKLASDIRLAQNYSLGSKTYNGTDTPPGGWGVHFVRFASNYIIFSDQAETGYPNGDKTYDAIEAIETKTLPAGVTISSLSPANQTNLDTVDIVFFPPDPITYVNGSATDSARIVLREDINNSTAAVTVNSFGLIDAN